MPAFMTPTVARVLVNLEPCSAFAYATDKMVYMVPTLAAALVLSRALTMKTDDDHDGEGDDAEGEGDGNGKDAESGASGVPDRVHDISLPGSFCSKNPNLTVRR